MDSDKSNIGVFNLVKPEEVFGNFVFFDDNGVWRSWLKRRGLKNRDPSGKHREFDPHYADPSILNILNKSCFILVHSSKYLLLNLAQYPTGGTGI